MNIQVTQRLRPNCLSLIILVAACSCSTTHNLDDQLAVAGYIVTTNRSPEGGGILTIATGGVVVHRQTNQAGAFYIGPNSPETDAKNVVSIRPGDDVNGNGIPDLIVIEWTGGAHCCYTAHVFELGEAVRKIGEIPGRDGGVLFKDSDADGVYEAVVQDEQGREVVFICDHGYYSLVHAPFSPNETSPLPP